MSNNGQDFKTGHNGPEPPEAPLTNHQLEDGDMAPANSKRSPAFQFYARDFLSSPKVDRMAMTERGAYITLLARCWLDNGLPTDLKDLAYFCRMKPAPFERMWKTGQIGKCFHERAGKFHNERLDAEHKKQTTNRQRQADNANARWSKRGNATALPEQHPSGITRADAPAADAKSNSNQQIGSSPSEEKKRPPDFDGQKAFMALNAAYPSHRASDDRMTLDAFFEQLQKNPPWSVAFDTMIANLENHKASEEWGRGVIPNLETWLAKGKWKGRYEEGPKVETSKTAGNRAVLQRFIDRGKAS